MVDKGYDIRKETSNKGMSEYIALAEGKLKFTFF